MGTQRLALALVIAASNVFASAQTTHIVTGGGNALQAAVIAASAGDILDVQPGIYSSVVCGKGVHIKMHPGAKIHITIGGSSNALEFVAIPTNETAILSGGNVQLLSVLSCQGTVIIDNVVYNQAPSLASMHIQSCSGPVVFVDSDAFVPGSAARGVFVITNSSQVSFTRCWVPRLVVTNSNVTATDTSLRTEGFGLEGMLIQSGRVVWQGGTINGTFPFSFPIFKEAIRINGGEFVATRGCLIERSWILPGNPDPSIEINGGTVRLDPSVTVTGAPGIVGPGTATITPVPSVVASHTSNILTMSVSSQPGDFVFMLAGLPRPPYATPWGTAWILPTDPVLQSFGVGPTGTVTIPYIFGAVPQHFVLTVQPVALNGAGTVTIGAPHRFTWK